MHHIWEFYGVSYEEDWYVVSYQVVVSVFGVELDGKASGITSCVCGSSRANHRRGPDKDGCLLLWVLKEFCTGVPCHTLVHLEVTMRTSAFGVHYSLRDALTVEVRELLDQMHVL